MVYSATCHPALRGDSPKGGGAGPAPPRAICQHKDGRGILTEPLQVGQFAIVDYEPVDRGPNAGIFHGRGPAGDRAELYIVAEGTTPAGESFAGHVVSAVGQSWGSHDMSLTGSLRRVFQEAERNLRDWNQKSIAQHRVSIGLACLGRRGPQAVVAQAGPSAVFHLHRGQLRAYFADEEHGRPIGIGGRAEPQLTRITMAPGDRLLLLSTAALGQLDDELIAGILALPPEQILPDLYQRVRELRNLTALLVVDPSAGAAALEAGDEMVIDATAPPPGVFDEPETFQASLFIEDDGAQAVAAARQRLLDTSRQARVRVLAAPEEAQEEIPLQRAAGDAALARLTQQRRARMAATWPALDPGGRPIPRSPRQPEPEATSRPRPRNESFSRGLVRSQAPVNAPTPPPSAPLAEDIARDLRGRTTAPAAATGIIAGEAAMSVGNGGSLVRKRNAMNGRWKGNGSINRRGPVIGSNQPPTWLIAGLGAGLLLILVGALTVPGMLESDQSARHAELVGQAGQKFAQAQVMVDPGERRAALAQAQALLLEARDAGSSSEMERLMQEVGSALTQMDAIAAPASVRTIASLSQFGAKPVTVARMAIAGRAAYLLDSNSSQVIAVALDSGEARAVFAEAREAGHSRPIAIAAAGEPGALLIADSQRHLWLYSPAADLREVPFAAPQGLTITDMATAGSQLFILDAGQSALYRFTAGENGYSLPVKVLETPDLAAARRLLVDGEEIVTVDANGTMRWFSGQAAYILSQGGIDEPLAAAEAPVLFGANGDIALVDPRKNRVVVFNREGTFIRQFRHKDFEGIAALATRDGVGYVFSGGALREVSWVGQ
jgi:hypothetical protein